MNSLVQRVLGWAITLVVVALLVRWAWQLIRPLLPVLGLLLLAGLALAVLSRR